MAPPIGPVLRFLPRWRETHLPSLERTGLYDLGVEILFRGRRHEAFAGLAALSRARPGQVVVDVGCGTGYFAGHLARVVAPTGRVIGIDPDPQAVDRARRQARPGCQFEVGTAGRLPVPDGCADLVVSSLSVHHVPIEEHRALMREIRRVLKPGGQVFLADLRRFDHESAVRGWGALIGCVHAALTETQLARLLTDNGFTVQRHSRYRGWMQYAAARPAEPVSA